MPKSEKDYAKEFARKGGHARAQSMTPEERRKSALKAIRARWKNQAAGEGSDEREQPKGIGTMRMLKGKKLKRQADTVNLSMRKMVSAVCWHWAMPWAGDDDQLEKQAAQLSADIVKLFSMIQEMRTP